MTVLADPHLLVTPTSCAHIEETAFWERVVLMGAVGQVELGYESFLWVVSQLEKLGYPEQQIDFGPPQFGRECQVAMERILTRVSHGSKEPEDGETNPVYLGDPDARLSIIFDSSAHGDSLHAIISDENYWGSPTAAVDIGPRRIELLIDPLQEPAVLRTNAIKAVFQGRRVHLVGGSPTPAALTQLQSELGLDDGQVNWIPSEKSKPPRDISKRWARLDPSRDVAVCITGRVSHAVWEQADKAAAKAGLAMIECASQGRLATTLVAWASRQGPRA